MSMSTHIYGFRPPDEKWKKMRVIWDACVEADIPVPKQVCNFFGDDIPNSAGVQVDIKKAVSPIRQDMTDGFEVDLTKLPKDVTKLRFVNSY
jgi:hypothetical protein